MYRKIICISTFTMILLFATGIALFSNDTGNPKNKGNITVEITNFKNNDGFVLIGLYNDAKGFPGTTESMIIRIKEKLTDKKIIAEFKDVPYGIYAISGYQDENNNGKLDTGMFKIPKEGMIVSNDAKGRMGPAKFEDAKFELKSKNLKLVIKVQFF
jgi:uncharacterized protein (DUF2141 family)